MTLRDLRSIASMALLGAVVGSLLAELSSMIDIRVIGAGIGAIFAAARIVGRRGTYGYGGRFSGKSR
ncbi:MAG TPA: hypothetical protein VM755_21905 [Stellaceae bacterium]|nr:hypothetical protein [Stellaceae bacterium]